MAKSLTRDEIELINQDAQRLVPGFRLFDKDEFIDAVGAAAQELGNDKDVTGTNGKPVMAKLVRKVVTSPKRRGYGVPFVWWWIFFEHEVLKGIDYDPWSEIRWWLFEELRGQGKAMTMWGAQNCLEPSTLVRMWDGSAKRADEIVIGDRLMGDDSTVRTVTSTCAGHAPMVRVTPKVGKPFVCTENHLVTCVRGFDLSAVVDIDASALVVMTGDELQRHNLIRRIPVSPDVIHGECEHEFTSFTVEPIGVGSFAGFEVDGNHRFLLADYTVTHNSGKTSWMGRFAIVQMIAWVGEAVVYATGPKKLHSEDKSWADSVEMWAKYLQRSKSIFVQSLDIRIHVGKHLVEISDEHGTARAKFVSAEDSSTIRGKKSHTHDSSGLRGITLVLVDEFVENPHLDLKGINQNSSSNFNFFMVLGCNPNPELVSHPNLRDFSFPDTVSNLDRTSAFRWTTPYGLCVRFAWANSPNNIVGWTRWPYLTDAVRVERQRSKGATAIDAEIDAWGFGSGARGAPLDEARIKLAGTYEEPMWEGSTTRIAVFDCAFGGQDPATAFIAECGPSFFKDRNGGRFTRQTIAAIDQVIIPVSQEFVVTDEWLDEMDELLAWTGGSWPEAVKARGLQPGDKLNGNYSMAYGAMRVLRDYSIKAEHCTFDSSQRGDCTSIMLDFLGRKNIRWFYDGSRRIQDEEQLTNGWPKYPIEYVADESAPGGRRAVQWSERCSAVISAIWFQACELISRGHLSNGEMCKKGLAELCARPVTKRKNAKEGKIDVISKDEMKKMGMASPTYAETLAIGIMLAARILKLIRIDEPETTVMIQAAPPSRAFIRSGQSRVFHAKRGNSLADF